MADKRCNICAVIKSPEQFYTNRKDCILCTVTHEHRDNGISHENYIRLFIAQDGRCAICRRIGTKRLSVDHDHETQKVRGLLCDSCNRGLGAFGDDLFGLRKAIQYLHKAESSELLYEVGNRRVIKFETMPDHWEAFVPFNLN